jgi:hypothetical protein
MAWMDPRPGASLCLCPEHFGLAEYMLELTGSTYGLPRARGHAVITVRKPEPPVTPPVRRPAVRQPWEPRPSRHSS